MFADDDPDVYLWQAGAHVDCEEESDGEVLGWLVGSGFGFRFGFDEVWGFGKGSWGIAVRCLRLERGVWGWGLVRGLGWGVG